MSDNRACIRNKVKKTIHDFFGIGRTSAQVIDEHGNKLLLPIGGIDGDSKKLETKDNTYNWAKSVEKKLDKEYQTQKYGGSVIEIDSKSNPKGTVVSITLKTALIDALERRNYHLQLKGKGKPVSNKVNQVLTEFATKNNLNVEFVDKLADKFGNDIAGLYNALDNTIKVSKGLAKEDTLAEEIVHNITTAIGGRKNVLVNALYDRVSKTDYKSFLGQEYVDLYEGDEQMLIKEAADKYITQQVIHGIKNPFMSSIRRIVDKFLSLFKGSDIADLAEIRELAADIARPIVNQEKITMVETVPEDKIFYQAADKKANQPSKIEKQLVYFKRRIGRLTQEANRIKDSDPEEYAKRVTEITAINKALAEYEETKSKDLLVDVANQLLDNIKSYIDSVNNGDRKPLEKNLEFTLETLAVFDSFKGTSDKAKGLYEELEPIVKAEVFEQLNKYYGKTTQEDLDKDIHDIGIARKAFGALADLADRLASTIGLMIKAAQNRIDTANKKTAAKIKEEVNLLKEWASRNGISASDMYDVFIQESYGTTVLTREYTTEFYELANKYYRQSKSDDLAKAKEAKVWLASNVRYSESGLHAVNPKYKNENYTKIQSTPELKRFYEFFKEGIAEAADKLPVKIGTNFIPNIRRDSLMDILKSDKKITAKLKEGIQDITGIDVHEFNEEDFSPSEELYADVVPLKYVAKIDAEYKSKDLGESLYKFMSFANSHQEMTEVLPKARLLQEQIKNKQYRNSAKPSIRINGEDSNIYKMVDAVIEMQVKGKKKDDKFRIKTGNVTNEAGEIIGEKYIQADRIIDFGLKYNSLLRIGLNPLNAVSNWLFGDISNTIEAIGGRFFTLKGLQQATNIFFKQNFDKDSDLNKLNEELNFLQELEDYTISDSISTKNLTIDKIKDKMYLPQRAGERFIQFRSAVAIAIKDGYMTSEGKLTDKFNNASKEERERLADKIQRVNQMMHGRYSERDMAIIQQNVLWRAAIQFKKWIPAAVEARFGGKQKDVRLGVEIEGRYITAYRLLWRDLSDTLKRLQSGEITELERYNMKKNLTEITLALASTLAYIGMGWDDDDEKLRNPYYKFCMNQLNRVSGDLLFLYDPSNMARTLKTPFPLIKTTQDLISVVKALPYAFYVGDYKFKHGELKGQNKFYAKLIGITPGAKPVQDVYKLFNEEKFVDYSNLP